jgi:hypothetical protein
MQAGNKEFSLRRFCYLFLLYAFLSFFCFCNRWLPESFSTPWWTLNKVKESGASSYYLFPSDCIGFLHVITCGKYTMGGGGGRTFLGVLYKIRLLMCTYTINTIISGHFLTL